MIAVPLEGGGPAQKSSAAKTAATAARLQMRRLNPSSAFTSSIRRRWNTHSTQIKAVPTAANDVAILMMCKGVNGKARADSMVPVTSTATKIGSSPYLSTV